MSEVTIIGVDFALLHKSDAYRSSAFRENTYPMAIVTCTLRAVKRFGTLARI
ncbi:hypothetical protein P775_22595 [Puniceibacterium antarcticum]|uniref:Uncharacterized protein n=1 Tax=Puniceibacterium antarcticum TaxID=1206336 RepID=A0A2G8R8L9_9RHOB|nr:hypothetical protein [Puniceibacterium antarcticum]PIL17900.1 hypothetical protein P775_22595 [Puniceibacterium antarcticum]